MRETTTPLGSCPGRRRPDRVRARRPVDSVLQGTPFQQWPRAKGRTEIRSRTMARTAVLGMPRVGRDRELKIALESYWAGRTGRDELEETARALRERNWRLAQSTGLDVVPTGDFSLYHHVLDTAWGLGAIPARFGELAADDLEGYFALARGTASAQPLEMTKWFDTNYHYLVPELEPGMRFAVSSTKLFDELAEAAALGIQTKPVLLGKVLDSATPFDRFELLDDLVGVYVEVLRRLAAGGAGWVQLDEPVLAL